MQREEEMTTVKESPLLPRSQGCLALRARTRSDPFLLPGRAEFFTTLRSRRGNARIRNLRSFFNTRASQSLFLKGAHPCAIPIPKHLTQPMVILRAGDMNCSAHWPRTYELSRLKGLIDCTNRRLFDA